MNWTELSIAFIAGGGTQAILNYINSTRAAKNDEFNSIVHTLQEDNDRLRKENKELRTELEELRKELHNLENIVAKIQKDL